MVKGPGDRSRIGLPEALPQAIPAQSKQAIAGLPGAPASLLCSLSQAFLRGLIGGSFPEADCALALQLTFQAPERRQAAIHGAADQRNAVA